MALVAAPAVGSDGVCGQVDEPNREFFKINKNFVQTVNYRNFTAEWIASKKCDNDLKVLVIENCYHLGSVGQLMFKLKISEFQNLFVVVLKFLHGFATPSNFEINQIVVLFEARPLILQMMLPGGAIGNIFVKDVGIGFTNLSAVGVYGDIRKLKQMLEFHGRLNGNILNAEMSIIKESARSAEFTGSVLCLRVINLFVGGCDRILPWLKKATRILDWQRMEQFLAFIDYPFDFAAAVELAWQFKRYDLVEIFVTKDCLFPKDFNIYQMLPHMNVGFKKILDQHQALHQSIAAKNVEEASKILDDIKKTRKPRRVFNEKGESAMATLLRNFDVKMYALLLNNKFKFCAKYNKLVLALPPETREIMAEKNFAYFTRFEAGVGEHPLMAKCLLATGHLRKDFYFGCIRVFLMQLENVPESTQLLRFAEKFPNLNLVFDFKNGDIGFMDPRHEGSSTACASFNPTGLIYISAFNMDWSVCGIIVHALASLTLNMVYRDARKPYPRDDLEREKEFKEAIAECRENYKNKVNFVVGDFYRVFETFRGDKVLAELVFCVPHILAGYSEGELIETKLKFAKIFDYYSKYVTADIELAFRSEKFKRI